MEEIIVIILILLTLLAIFCLYKIFDKRGLYFSLVMFDLIAFVLTFKITYVFKMNINIGIIPLISTFTILYIFLSKYNIKETNNLLKITLYANITTALLLIVTNYFIPTITETISINMKGTFEHNYKILIVYPIITYLSQLTSIKLYGLLQQIQDNVSISMILTYIITGILYTIVMYILSYINILQIPQSLFLGVSTYILGIAVTLINVIFINILDKKKVIKWWISY